MNLLEAKHSTGTMSAAGYTGSDDRVAALFNQIMGPEIAIAGMRGQQFAYGAAEQDSKTANIGIDLKASGIQHG